MNATEPKKWYVGSYRVVIKREGNQYVARNAKGDWVTKGKYIPLPSSIDVAKYLFHGDELESVEAMTSDGRIVARIRTSNERQVEE